MKFLSDFGFINAIVGFERVPLNWSTEITTHKLCATFEQPDPDDPVAWFNCSQILDATNVVLQNYRQIFFEVDEVFVHSGE